MKPYLFSAVVLLAAIAWAGTPGTFRGIVVRPANTEPGWIYVQAANGGVRRVDVSRAVVFFSDSVPRKQRTAAPKDALREGADLRVTAELDDGEWRATQVEILKLSKDSGKRGSQGVAKASPADR